MARVFFRLHISLFWMCFWQFSCCLQQVWDPNSAPSSTRTRTTLPCEFHLLVLFTGSWLFKILLFILSSVDCYAC